MVRISTCFYAIGSMLMLLLDGAFASPIAGLGDDPGQVEIIEINAGPARMLHWRGGFTDMVLDEHGEPGWRKKSLYHLYGVQDWSPEGNNATITTLFNNLVRLLNGEQEKHHLLQFSWGTDAATDQAFALIFCFDLPQGKHGELIEKAVEAAGGPHNIHIEIPYLGFHTQFVQNYLSIRQISDLRPRPYRFHYNMWADFMDGPYHEASLDDMYLGVVCLGKDGMGGGCKNPCGAYQEYPFERYLPAPPCAPY